MGNRGNVIFTNGERISPCVYLHWNGGPESVYRFLAELDAREVRPDAEYEAARFVEIVGEFFSLRPHETDTITLSSAFGLSLGIVNGPSEISADGLSGVYTDESDNGFYVVDRTQEHWARCVRRFTSERLADGHYGLKEWGREQVMAEQDEAWAFARYDGIADFFAELRAATVLKSEVPS